MREHLKNPWCQSVTQVVRFSLPSPPLQPLDYVWHPFTTPSLPLTYFDIIVPQHNVKDFKDFKNFKNFKNLWQAEIPLIAKYHYCQNVKRQKILEMQKRQKISKIWKIWKMLQKIENIKFQKLTQIWKRKSKKEIIST